MKKRFLAVLLVLVLIMSIFPPMTLATIETGPIAEEVTFELLDSLLGQDDAISEQVTAEEIVQVTETVSLDQNTRPPAHVAVQPGDMRIENDSLRMDIGRLGQITRLNIVDMDLSRPQSLNPWREMNFVAGVHTFASNFRNSADHQWIGEMIFSTRTADTREGLATAGPFREVDTNRLLQAGGRATHNSPNNDTHVNPFFTRIHDDTANTVTNRFNPDSGNMPTGNEVNPAGGNLNTNMEIGGQTVPRRDRIITDFQVESTFDADQDDDSILWSITITNPGTGYIEFGDIGLPMLWNARFSRPNTGAGTPANNTEHVYDNSVIQHSFQGADSGFLQIVPPRGDNYLIFAPVPQSGARIEYVDHWTLGNWGVGNVHRPDFGIWRNDSGGGGAGDANNYNLHGMTVAYIHSASIRNFTGSSYFHDTARGPTYFTDTNRFPARYNPVAPGAGFGGGANPSGPEYTPLFTTLVLGPGDSQTYEFRFHAVRGGDGTPEEARGGRNNHMDAQNPEINHMMEREMNQRSILHDMGIIDAVAVPSFQPAINMQTLIALRHDRAQVVINEVVIYCIHENDVFSNQHIPAWGSQAGRNRSRVINTRGGRGLHDANPGFETNVEFRADLSGYHNGEWVSIYELSFGCIGHNSVRVYYDLIDDEGDLIRPAFAQYEFNVLTELNELTTAHADFLTDIQQFWSENTMNYAGDNPRAHPLYGIFFDFHLNSGITRIGELPVAIQNSVIATPATPNARWGDDWSKGHGLFLAMANYMNPDYDSIRSLETYLIDFMWNRYMANRHESFLAAQWIATSPINNNTSTTGDRFFGSALIANTFFNMYRIQRAFPELMEFREDALFYLDVAAGMWDNGLRGGWGSSAGVAFYGEQQLEDLIQALHREGRTHRLNTFRGFFANTRVNADFGTFWPFRSEFEYDNTTEEGLYARTISMLRHFPNHPQVINTSTGENRALRHMQVFNWSTRAKRGTVPTWFQYGVPTFRGGESWWNFQYTTSLAGFIMDDWLRLRYDMHDWDNESIAWANRVNYAAKIGNFNHVNMGQMNANNIGASSVTYSMRKGTFGAQAVQISNAPIMHNGWHDMGMEAPLSLYGSLLSISTDVLNDPIFGPFAYGGEVVSYSAAAWTVRPTDGFGRRLNFLNERVYIYSVNNRIEEARFNRNRSSIEFDMVNLQSTAHTGQVETYGLTPGFYNILVDGAPAGQFYVHSNDRNDGFTGVGPRRNEATATFSVPTDGDFTVAFVRASSAEAAEPTLNIVANSQEPWAGDEMQLLVEIIGDGFSQIDNISWEVVSAPVDDSYTFNARTPHLGGAAHTTGRRNSTWVNIDSSSLRGPTFTPNAPGQYVIRVTVQSGSFTVYELHTINVIENPNIAPPTIRTLDYTQDANFITITAEAETFDRANREIDISWELISWPAGGQSASIIIPGNATQIIDMGGGTGHFTRTTATLAIPRSGEFVVRFTVTDMGRTRYEDFVISAHGDFNITAYNVVSQAGVVPTNLPQTALVPVGGEMQSLPVVWNNLDVSRFMEPGSAVELFGTVTVDANTTVTVTTTVFVVADVNARVNMALEAEAPTGNVQASFTNTDQGGLQMIRRPTPPDGTSANYGPSTNPARGAWHTWGQETQSQWLRYTWNEPVLMDRMEVFTMQPGNGNFRPINDMLLVRDIDGNWFEPRNIQGFGSEPHIWNVTTFEPQFITGLEMRMSPGGNGGLGIGIMRWWPFSYEMEGSIEPPVEVDISQLQILRDAAFEMNGGNIEGGGTPGTTARFANWGTYGDALNAARIAAEGVIASPQSQTQVDEATAILAQAITRLTSVNMWEIPANTAQGNNIAFHARRTGSSPSPGQAHRINNINNNVAAGNWGTWGVGPLPSLNGSLAVPGGNFGVHWLQYDWPQGVQITQSNIRHWRDAWTGTGGVNTPSVLRFWYLPLDSDNWVMETEWTRAQLVDQIGNAGAQQWSSMSFGEPIHARAVRVEFGRLATGTGQGVGVSQWQILGTLLTQQAAPSGFVVTHNTTLEGTAGAIAGVTDTMEWRTGATGAWQPIAEETTALTGLANGNFYIRYAGFETTAPSPATRVGIRMQRTEAPVGISSEPASYGLADGLITGVTTAMEWSDNANGPWTAVTGLVIPNLAEGYYYVRYALTLTSSYSPSARVFVGRWAGETVPHDPPTGLSANPPSRPSASDGDIRGVTSSMEWRPVGEDAWTRVVGIAIPNLATGSYEVRMAASARNSASEPVVVVVPAPQRGGQAAPTGLIAVAPSVIGHTDGQILRVNATMEWARNEAGPWIAVAGTSIDNLAPGTYFVRRAETATHYASEFISVEVPEAQESLTTVEFRDTRPAQLALALERGDVLLATPSNLGIFAQHSPFVIPEGRTLVIATTLNVQRDAELVIYGTVVLLPGGRINNQGNSSGGGTIRIAEGGRLENNGYVENVSNSNVVNNGTIVNNARFEIRASTHFRNFGAVAGSAPLSINRNAIIVE